jgi:MFS transporter, ACS family, glucarate transporter
MNIPSIKVQSRPAGSEESTVSPSKVRWRVMAFLVIVSALTFLDRLNLSIAGKYIQEQFRLSTQTMGWILSAFVLGYALFQVPAGWLGDHYGPRSVITIAIVWWSLFTALTAVAARLPFTHWFGVAWSFAIIRFIIGLGEGATFPNANKIVALWMGTAQRGIGNSTFLAGIGVGGVLTPVLIAWVMTKFGWQISFAVCGCIGLVVAAAWHSYVTDRPAQHPSVNAAELAEIDASQTAPRLSRSVATEWRGIFSSPSVAALVLSYFFLGYVSYLYYTWFYLYLVDVRHLGAVKGGLWGSTPFLAIALMTPLGGWLSDFASRRLGKRRGRQSVVWLGLASSTVLLWMGSRAAGNTAAIVLLAIAAGFVGFANTGWWAACNDLTQNFSGSLSGLMNMGGNIGGWLSPILTAYIATRWGWKRALDFAGLMSLTAGVLWFFIDADRSLDAKALQAGPS